MDALWAIRALVIDAVGLGGIWLRAGHGPVRDAWLGALHQSGLPVVKMPASADDQALRGGIDLAQSLQSQTLKWQPGLLARAHGGVIQLPMAERVPKELLARLSQALDQRRMASPKGGDEPAEFAVVALDESDEDDSRLSAGFADRLGIWLDLRSLTMHDLSDEQILEQEQSAPRGPRPRLTDDQLEALCGMAQAMGIDSPRAVLFASRLASVSAWMEGRPSVDESDLVRASRCVLLPRATRWPAAASESAPEQDPPPPPPSPQPPSESPEETLDDAQSQSAAEQEVQPLEDMLLAATLASLPDHLLDTLLTRQAPRGHTGTAGHSGRLQHSRQRGRPLPSRPGRPHDQSRLDLLATLRHAAPRQRLRAQTAHHAQSASSLQLRSEDFHVRRYEQRSTTCLILALDASGSAAMQRLAQAKGAVELLLAQSYARRDSVSVIAFRGTQAQCLLPPTRSLVRAKRALAGLPGGGGTPLASALHMCLDQALKLRREGSTPQLVVLSDGRANVNLQGMGGRVAAQADAQHLAQQWAAYGLEALWIDTALQPEPLAQAMAMTMGARYLPMPHVQAQRLAHAMRPTPSPGAA